MSLRVRFAPSPTGNLHVGGARTALFNWLVARQSGGQFILRIDDTDRERSSQEFLESILAAMKWLGLDWDEGPYFQSQRAELYRRDAERLLAEDKAYLCYCLPEELARQREAALKAGRPAVYDGRCRDLTRQDRERLEAGGRQPVVRLKVSRAGETVVRDLIRGGVVFNNEVLDDFIIVKSNGMPAYNFACVVDDALMGITHVIRAEEHLSNTPRQLALYRALGYAEPYFAHVPMILAPDRSKLSKRHGATSVEEYRDQGYLPQALTNYLALLGWSPGTEEEIIPQEELVKRFSLERVSLNPSIYDLGKLTWMNGHYLVTVDLEEITSRALPFFQRQGLVSQNPSPKEVDYLRQVVGLVRDRVKTLVEVVDAATYFFTDDWDYEEKGAGKYFTSEAAELLAQAGERLAGVEPFTAEAAEAAYRQLAEELGVKTPVLFHPTRLALTGRTMGPGLFGIMAVLGREKCLERLSRAAVWIRNAAE
ncbi:MAG: glutamate--tRNA ligase [Clostridia bacterium]|nr:MAG: glutamate--tRNA ligase [Clostridia bacterium]